MPARSARYGGRGGGHSEEKEDRWLLTYADMITLLLALFILLFAISSVNISKYRTLQKALKAAFSGQILPGGRHLQNMGASEQQSHTPETTATTSVMNFGLESASQTRVQSEPHHASEMPSLSEQTSLRALEVSPGVRQAAAQLEQEHFQSLRREVEAYVAAHNLQSSVSTTLIPRGLDIRLLTDKLLFASGQATLSPTCYPLLEEIAGLLIADGVHPIAVEGNTDSIPIHNSVFASNWELSTTRADTIVRFLIAHGVAAQRLSAVGYAAERPIAGNETEAGRSRNRRVDVVLERLYQQPGEEGEG